MPELAFIPNLADEGEGLSDAGIETYRDNPFPAVARETSQNSRDAHDRERCPDEPVRVVIDKILVPAQSLPGYGAYLNTVRRCLEVAEKSGTKKEIAFFSQAERVLSAADVPVLRVADYGTRGLRGPCEEGHPFHALVKSSGISDKPDDTAGGSFGIGKSAVYSASDLQTVFYSTLYPENGSLKFLCQGKTKFRSFTDADGKPFRSIGYWGEATGYLPVSDPQVVPEWLRRDEIGTTVCSIAVRDTDDWGNKIVASLVTNFFSAIQAGRMEFAVDGDLINANTLRRRFDEAQVAAVANEEDFEFARAMYDCLTDEHDAVEHVITIAGVGDFRVRILLRDGFPKRIGILRNGMYVCDSLIHFEDKLNRFPMFRDFVAIVEPIDEGSNSWLRAMENPRHDELSPERLLEPEHRRAAKRDGKRLAKQIREHVAQIAKSAKVKDTDLEELSEFFAIDNQGREDESGARKVESFKVRKPARQKNSRQSKPPADEGEGTGGGGAEGTHPGTGTGGGGGGGGPGEAGGGAGSKARKKPLPLLSPRTIAVAGDPHERRIFFTPAESGEAIVRFESSGVSEPEPLTVNGGDLRISCIEGQRQEIQVRFEEAYDGPIEIISWRGEGIDEA